MKFRKIDSCVYFFKDVLEGYEIDFQECNKRLNVKIHKNKNENLDRKGYVISCFEKSSFLYSLLQIK